MHRHRLCLGKRARLDKDYTVSIKKQKKGKFLLPVGIKKKGTKK